MKPVIQSVIVVLCGLPGAVLSVVATIDAVRMARTFNGPQQRDLMILVGFFAGPGAVVLVPVMWLTFRAVAASLSRPMKWALAAFAGLSTCGSVVFWIDFLT